ncbi:MAG: acyl carrier protein [Gammaproteobacteria bacterium]|nr:MAG: acyl carrier protein [Gammaproteobacteria bacterium]
MQTREEIFDMVADLLEELFEVDKSTITMETNLYEDLDIDSIDAVDLVVKLKTVTGKKIQPDEFKTVRTMENVVDVVSGLVNK